MYMFFNEKIHYSLESGFGTASIAREIQTLRNFSSLVEMGGIEPPS